VRLVLDTNIVLSALLWRGTPYQLLTRINQTSTLQLVSSPVMLEELADVLNAPAVHQTPVRHRAKRCADTGRLFAGGGVD